MKFLLSVAAVIAVAVAVPTQRGLVAPGPAGPVPAPDFEPIAIGPAIIDSFEPISVGPAIVDFPVPDGGLVAEPVVVPSPLPIAPSPVSIVPGPAAASGNPLVQIILNINQAAADLHPISVGPAIIPTPVEVVDVPPMPVHPIGIVAPETPVPVEPVVIGTPVLPEPAVVLPEPLN